MSERPSLIASWRWAIVLAFSALFPLLAWGAWRAQLSNNNSIEQWLPSSFDASQDYQRFLEHFGTDEFVLVSWQGCTIDDARLPRFAEAIRRHAVNSAESNSAEPEEEALFARVTSGADLLDQLTSPPLLLETEAALDRLFGLMIGRKEHETGVFITLSPTGNENRTHAIGVIRDIATNEIGIDAKSLHMAGDAVANAAVDQASEEAILGLIGLSSLVAVLMSLLSLRSFRLLIVICTISTYSFLFSQSLVYFIDLSAYGEYFSGRMNLVLVVMPVLVYVLALSAGIHLVNYYRDAARQGSLLRAPGEAIRVGWGPCALAAGTTAIGVGSLAVSHIRPVRDFGSYSAVGILGSLVILFLLLPALLSLFDNLWIRFRGGRQPDWPRPVSSVGVDSSSWLDRLSRVPIEHHAVTSTICVVVLAFFAWGALDIKTNLVTRRFFADDHPLCVDFDWLAEKIGPQVPMEIVVKFDTNKSDLNTLDQLKVTAAIQQRVREIDQVNATLSAWTFYRPIQGVGLLPSVTKDDTTNTQLEKHRERFEEARMISSEGDTQLWRISCRTRGIEDSEGYKEFLGEIQKTLDDFQEEAAAAYVADREAITKGYAEAYEKLAKVLDKQEAKLADDPQALALFRARYDARLEDYQRQEKQQLAEVKDSTAGVEAVKTGMVPLFYVAQQELFDGLVNSFLVAFLLIAVVMIARLHSLRAGLLVMLPNVFPVLVVFGAMGWSGRFVDIGSMMTASVAMGIAVDDTVHFLTWFRRGMSHGMNRKDAVRHAYRRCAVAMTQTTLIAGLSLLVFGLSSFQPVSQFGILMFVLLVGALVGDLVFLPALLAGPAGRFFEERQNRLSVATESRPVGVR